MREPNRVRQLVETAVKADALARKCKRVLHARYGFTDAQISAMTIAKRAPNDNLAIVLLDEAQHIMRRPHGVTLQPPRTVFRPRKGQIF